MLVFSLAVLLPLLPFAQDDGLGLKCGGKPIETYPMTQEAGEEGKTRCDGGAVVTYQDMRAEAEWIEFDRKTRELTAGDHVRFQRAGQDLTGGRLSYNVASKTGTLADASGMQEGWFLKAGDYELLADGKWHLTRVTSTACSGDCPAWRMSWKEVTVKPGEEIVGKGMVFRFRNVPLFYLPRFRVPAESKERSSGFLFPSTSTSTTKGRSFRETYYWAVNRSQDLALTGEYFSLRGPAGTVEYRAVPNERTDINVNTFFAIDRKDQGGYRTDIRASTRFGEDWRALALVNLTSSIEFRQVYGEGFNLISSPMETSVGFATKNGSNSSLNFLFSRSTMSFFGQSSTVLRKSPAFDLQLPSRDVGGKIPIYFSLDGGFAGMSRRDAAIDTPAFVERLDAYPSIQIPLLRSSLLTWSHQIGLRETVYSHSLNPGVVSDALYRSVLDYSTRITGPQLERNFGSWRHLVEPTFEYRYTTGVDSFDRTIVMDDIDLLSNTNEIEYGITNRFVAGHEFLTWRIAQKLYFDPGFGGALIKGRRNTLEPLMDLTGFAFSSGEPRRLSPVVSTMRIATTPSSSTDIEVDYDTYRKEFRSAGILGGLSRGLFGANIGYFFNKRTEIQSPSNQLRGLFTYGNQTRRGVNLGFGFYYDIYRSIFQGSTTQVSYNAECYGLSVEFTQYDIGVRKESRLRFSFSFKNLGSLGTLRPQERLF